MPLYQTLLLIDDDVDDHEIFMAALESVHPEALLVTAQNGVDALHLLLEKRSFPELIFLDINMPVMNGFEFLTKVKTYDSLKAIPVIMFSTTSSEQTIEEAKKLGADEFISKPAQLTELERILTATLNKQYRHEI